MKSSQYYATFYELKNKILFSAYVYLKPAFAFRMTLPKYLCSQHKCLFQAEEDEIKLTEVKHKQSFLLSHRFNRKLMCTLYFYEVDKHILLCNTILYAYMPSYQCIGLTSISC